MQLPDLTVFNAKKRVALVPGMLLTAPQTGSAGKQCLPGPYLLGWPSCTPCSDSGTAHGLDPPPAGLLAL